MNSGTVNLNMIPLVFILLLFLLIALLSCAIIAAGGNVYASIVDNMEQNYESRVSFSYITTKIRQNDNSSKLDMIDFNGVKTISINEILDGSDYSTYLYYYNGYIYELFFERGLGLEDYLSCDDGEAIIKASDFEFSFEGNKIFLTLVKENGKVMQTQITVRSKKGGG